MLSKTSHLFQREKFPAFSGGKSNALHLGNRVIPHRFRRPLGNYGVIILELMFPHLISHNNVCSDPTLGFHLSRRDIEEINHRHGGAARGLWFSLVLPSHFFNSLQKQHSPPLPSAVFTWDPSLSSFKFYALSPDKCACLCKNYPLDVEIAGEEKSLSAGFPAAFQFFAPQPLGCDGFSSHHGLCPTPQICLMFL